MSSPPASAPDLSLREMETLLARVAAQDRQAFADLYRHSAAQLFGLCLHVLTDRSEAEVALRATYVRLWTRADRFPASGLSPMTWLLTQARDQAVRRQRLRQTVPQDSSPPDAQPAPAAGRIGACLNALEPDMAEALRRAYLHGASYDDLAAQLGQSAQSLRATFHHNLTRLAPGRST